MSSPMMDRTDVHDQIIYSEDAERSVLGGMMLSETAIADVVEVVRVEDFYRPQHQAIFAAIVGLYHRNCPIDAVAVGDELTRRGEFTRVGGGPYLHTLIAAVPTAANVSYYARIVQEKAAQRRLIEAGHRIVQYGQNASGEEIATALARAQEELDQAANVKTANSEIVRAGDLIDEMYAEIEKFQSGSQETGIGTGIMDLDTVLHGLRPGQMITIAARPGVGKSVLGVQLARQCAIEQGKPAVIFSLEMSRMEIMIRMAAAESGVRLDAIHSEHGLSDHDWARLARGMSRVKEAPLFIDDEATATVTEIRAKAKRLHKRHDLGLIVVDYLQLMGSGKRVESRQQEVSEFSRQLKLLAKELDVPVVAISQLNRGPEQRQDKRPMLADLRESGSIEQDSDVVILIHRPDANGAQDEPRAGEADLIVAKNRGGQTATVTVAHQMHWSRFKDLARE
ncbi:replicative DNA helicase [Saccharomonospora glauca]|uniref:Replicative DNA helicase n=1 Tax=Saccharomonospora glauca K62 TaxID=928724 RepID=I1D8F5_9PSEU|nr:replicative DNA helicase [Saccharomonospora glauca]EIF01230.1 replicative DNA helicase [Saccharomonospora glauca K62]